jgi:hypothetical protein
MKTTKRCKPDKFINHGVVLLPEGPGGFEPLHLLQASGFAEGR